MRPFDLMTVDRAFFLFKSIGIGLAGPVLAVCTAVVLYQALRDGHLVFSRYGTPFWIDRDKQPVKFWGVIAIMTVAVPMFVLVALASWTRLAGD